MSYTHQCFAEYERRFARAMALIPERVPWTDSGRAEIQDVLRGCLGIRPDWTPTIRVDRVRNTQHDSFTIEYLQSHSWPGVRGAAHLYVPIGADGPRPLVLLCCGHGQGGKLNAGYQAMARAIVQRGALVLVPDNIGQGERTPMGHANVVAPFACGTSLQGLIVMETLGWLACMQDDERVDTTRLGAVGNSGGGHLTTYLSALSPDLAVLSSSGRPTTNEFVARKEKKLCHCSIVPGIVGELEMWQILGCFAPKPMFIFQGLGDSLFPADLFHLTARKLRTVYRHEAAADHFRAAIVPGEHSWDAGRRLLLGDYLTEVLDLPGEQQPASAREGPLLAADGQCFRAWPDGALDTDGLARQLTGVQAEPNQRLCDVFPPAIDGARLEKATERGDTLQILAQFETFLKDDNA